MDKWDWHTPEEEQFDALLKEGAMELPAEEMVRGISPWRKAVNGILWGFGLITVTLNFGGLQYILPILGYLLLLQGFRALRQENLWFRVCWLMTFPRLSLHILQLCANATILPELRSFEPFKNTAVWLGVIFALLHYVFFWNALSAVQQKADIDPHYGVIVGLFFWYLMMCLLSMAGYNGFLLAAGMIVIYILILVFLHKLSKGLDEAGYCIQPAKVKIPTWLINSLIIAVLLAGILCSKLLFSRFPMDWQHREQKDDVVLSSIRDQLTEKGFPTDVLADLAEEDLRECFNAKAVVVQTEELPMNEGREVREYDGERTVYTTVYDEKELLFTHIAVQLAGEEDRWKMFHHFRWVGEGKFPGTECLYAQVQRDWAMEKQVDADSGNGVVFTGASATGQVLYDRDGQTYVAPFFGLQQNTRGDDPFAEHLFTNNAVKATCSFPAKGEGQRGYLSYVGSMNNKSLLYFDCWVTYVHQKNLLNYPGKSAATRIENGTTHNAPGFKNVQTALQFKISEYYNQKHTEM